MVCLKKYGSIGIKLSCWPQGPGFLILRPKASPAGNRLRETEGKTLEEAATIAVSTQLHLENAAASDPAGKGLTRCPFKHANFCKSEGENKAMNISPFLWAKNSIYMGCESTYIGTELLTDQKSTICFAKSEFHCSKLQQQPPAVTVTAQEHHQPGRGPPQGSSKLSRAPELILSPPRLANSFKYSGFSS